MKVNINEVAKLSGIKVNEAKLKSPRLDIGSVIPENTSYVEFAEAVAFVLINDYEEHNYAGFIEILKNTLQQSTGHLVW